MEQLVPLAIRSMLGLVLVGSATTIDLPDRFRIPATVSREAANGLAAAYAIRSRASPPRQPISARERDDQREALDRRAVIAGEAVADALGVTRTGDRLGNVPVVRLRPARSGPSENLLIYLHGGAYTFFSARSRLIPPALVAAATGYQVISIDYTPAPRGNWKIATDQVVAVWRAILAKHMAHQSIGIFGDSAGGGLAAGSVLKMRDLGLPLPGALYLMSPWSDITMIGDSYRTLASVDPILDVTSLRWSADAYATPGDQRNPYVSPVYGDYSKAFPPTLIQGGTREMFLSNFVRQYQAIRSGDHEAVLDLYEGMPHVFQNAIPYAAETRTAVGRAAAFLTAHLVRRVRRPDCRSP